MFSWIVCETLLSYFKPKSNVGEIDSFYEAIGLSDDSNKENLSCVAAK